MSAHYLHQLDAFQHPVEPYPAYGASGYHVAEPWSGYQEPMATQNNTPHLVENTYCSDFTCCGMQIPNMHDLVAHYEDVHCVTISPDGTVKPLIASPYPSEASSPNSAYSGPPSPTEDDLRMGYPAVVDSAYNNAEFYPAHQVGYYDPANGFNLDPNSFDVGYAVQGGAFIPLEYCQPPPYIISSPTISHAVPPSSIMRGPQPNTVISNSPPTRSAPLSPRSPATEAIPFVAGHSRQSSSSSVTSTLSMVDIIAPSTVATNPPSPIFQEVLVKPRTASSKSAKSRSRASSSVHKRKKAAARECDPSEKPFKCPNDGCTKRYLNPNGLTYHLRKGTCDIAGA